MLSKMVQVTFPIFFILIKSEKLSSYGQKTVKNPCFTLPSFFDEFLFFRFSTNAAYFYLQVATKSLQKVCNFILRLVILNLFVIK